MMLSRCQLLLLATGLVISPALVHLRAASAGTGDPATTAQPSATPPVSDRFMAAKSPVDLFRELLAMDAAERDKALVHRTPEIRQRLLEKLREYEALPPDERELRLRSTELRWYLLPMLSLPATNRLAQLPNIPADLRPAVQERLDLWNVLPPPLQEELLENDQRLQLYLQLESSTPVQKTSLLQTLPASQRADVEAGFNRWRALPAAERRKAPDRVNQFFELTPDEKSKVLNTLSEPERRQMDATLRAFEKLTAEQRAMCIRSFARFANMTPAQQREFLEKAERWKAMPPSERQAWRDLVHEIPIWPPEPPDLDLPMPPMPPPDTTVTTGGK